MKSFEPDSGGVKMKGIYDKAGYWSGGEYLWAGDLRPNILFSRCLPGRRHT